MLLNPFATIRNAPVYWFSVGVVCLSILVEHHAGFLLSAHIRNTQATASTCFILIFQHLCEHCLSSQHVPIAVLWFKRLSCHACIRSTYTLLWHNQVRAAMFDHVVVQHDGLSWTIGCRSPTERQCVLHAAHGAVSRGADPSSRSPRRLHGPRDEQPRCSFWQDRTQQ